jgi:hypothetical protein
MESRIAQIERMMQDKTLSHSDQQLLDQELDELMSRMDLADELRAIADFLEPEDAEPVPHCWNCGERGHNSVRCPMPIEIAPQCTDCGGNAAFHTCPRGKVCAPCMARYLDEEEVDTTERCDDCGSTEDLIHVQHRDGISVWCADCDRGCPCCEGRCADCGRRGHMNRTMRDGVATSVCDNCVEDTRGCGNCSGCAYCMSLGDYCPADEI